MFLAIPKILSDYREMVVYTGTTAPVNIKYTGGNTAMYNGGTGLGGNNGYGNCNLRNTTPTLLSGYILRVNNIVGQLIETRKKVTALERLNILERQMEISKKKGLF